MARATLIKNYFKVAIRHILKHKGFSFINIVGLAIGIACSVLILLYVSHELSYGKFHEKADRIYRLALRASIGDTKISQTLSSSETFRRLQMDSPEIVAGVKILKLDGTPVVFKGNTFYEQKFFAVDDTFFDIFTFPLIHGDLRTVLTEPNTMVISEATALRYFGSMDAVGKILRADFSFNSTRIDFKITGISENVPDNSHFHYDFLVSSSSFPALINNKDWSANNFITYLLLQDGISQEVFDEKLKEFVRNYLGRERFDAWVAEGNYWELYLQPLTGIHLNSDLNGEFEANGNATYVYIFLIVSLIILFIACINFMNLSMAKSSLRAKEVGMRKVVGSNRSGLVLQFLSESLVLSFISLAIGLVIVVILLPFYGNLIGRQLEIHLFDNWFVFPSLLGLGLGVGLVSGSYPAFFLSSFKPITVFRGISAGSKGNSWLRNILVIFQFTISIFLIIGTLVVNQQLKFFQNTKLGFDKEQVLVVQNPGALENNTAPFKETLCKHSSIVDVSGSNTLPGRSFNNIFFGAEGVNGKFTLNLCVCDHDFLKTLKLEMAQGRFFSREFPSDAKAAVINEKAAEVLGWENPLGKKIWDLENQRKFTVIGVIKDYHYESLHQEIRPQAQLLSGDYYTGGENYISVRLNTENIVQTILYVENTWKNFAPGKPFEYSFLDDDYDSLYMNEMQTRKLFSIFSFLAIFIACLGLFGLASFIAERKTNEIGIRKILGASVPRIVNHLNKRFIKWVLIATLIAWPAAWYAMSRWLQNFAYRIDLSWWMFVLAAVLAIMIALITVSFQTVKAALKNPADSLRYE
jgi:putative ABC transport system permease protein